jgi:hypothetical protein
MTWQRILLATGIVAFAVQHAILRPTTPQLSAYAVVWGFALGIAGILALGYLYLWSSKFRTLRSALSQGARFLIDTLNAGVALMFAWALVLLALTGDTTRTRVPALIAVALLFASAWIASGVLTSAKK